MISIGTVEEQLQAITAEIERLRRDNVPGYMMQRSLEHIESRIHEVRRALSPALVDLHAFHRVADLLAYRMVRDAAMGEMITTAVRAAVVEVEAERAQAARTRDAIRDFRDGRSSQATLLDMLPAWVRTAPPTLVAMHLRSLGIDEAEADTLTKALKWSPLPDTDEGDEPAPT
ncbi:MAG: hypothetical protein KGS10_04190 [Chloroflexi bacterium]|nr:hypothetical protein [Chloroflexota bacterium]